MIIPWLTSFTKETQFGFKKSYHSHDIMALLIIVWKKDFIQSKQAIGTIQDICMSNLLKI